MPTSVVEIGAVVYDCATGQFVLDSGRRFYNLHGPMRVKIPVSVILAGDEWYPL